MPTEVTIRIAKELTAEQVKELFNEFNEEEKRELIQGIIHKFLNTTYEDEKKAFAQPVVDKLRQEMSWNGSPKYSSDYSIENSDDYRKKMCEFKSAREQMLLEISYSLKQLVKEEVEKHVAASPIVQKMIDVCLETFPRFMTTFIQNELAHKIWDLLHSWQAMATDPMMVNLPSRVDTLNEAVTEIQGKLRG